MPRIQLFLHRKNGGLTIHQLEIVACLAALVALRAHAQSPPDPNFVRQQIFPSYQAFKDELNAISATADPVQRQTRLDTLWTNLRNAGQVPYAQDNRYALLYRGSASSVAFPGDHNSWQPNSAPATQLAGTNLWLREGTLPDDARIDYKIVLNGNNWVLDPNNSLQMWSGFGPNSELRMPEYLYPRETIRRPNVARGTLTGNTVRQSTNLGYQVQYRVYTPAGYTAQQLADLPVVYVTDGHEYLADHMGSLVSVLDNLIDDGTLRPTMAVFIDPRDPANLNYNRRLSEYNTNSQFAAFVANELVPAIDSAYRTLNIPADRVILGTSAGGHNSAYFGVAESDTFLKIAIQSPAFQLDPSIYTQYDKAPIAPLEIYMTHGTVNDGNGGPSMNQILARNGYDYTFVQANEGHSWGNWRGQLGDLLVTLVGAPAHVTGDYNRDGMVDSADYAVWRNSLGQNVVRGQGADGNTNGAIDADDYNVWRRNFGSTSVAAANAEIAMPIPEPACGCLLSTGIALVLTRRTCGLRANDCRVHRTEVCPSRILSSKWRQCKN